MNYRNNSTGLITIGQRLSSARPIIELM